MLTIVCHGSRSNINFTIRSESFRCKPFGGYRLLNYIVTNSASSTSLEKRMQALQTNIFTLNNIIILGAFETIDVTLIVKVEIKAKPWSSMAK